MLRYVLLCVLLSFAYCVFGFCLTPMMHYVWVFCGFVLAVSRQCPVLQDALGLELRGLDSNTVTEYFNDLAFQKGSWNYEIILEAWSLIFWFTIDLFIREIHVHRLPTELHLH